MAVVVEAVGSASTSLLNRPLGSMIESAMVIATQQCFDDGISDPTIILERKLAAREEARAQYAENAAN